MTSHPMAGITLALKSKHNMAEQKQRRPRQAFFDVHAFLLRRIVCVDGMCYIALTPPFLCAFRDPFVLEPLPPTHYFPSPARKLSKREQQVRSPVQLLEGSQYVSLAAHRLLSCPQLHLAVGGQFSPSRSEITAPTVPKTLSSLEGPHLSCSSTETSWESWPSSKPSTPTGGGVLGLRPLSRCVSGGRWRAILSSSLAVLCSNID